MKQRSVKFKEQIKLRKTMVISDAERLRRSVALKNYWEREIKAQEELQKRFRTSGKIAHIRT